MAADPRAPTWASLASAALVEEARAGEARAFAELTRRYRPRIHAFALQLTGDPSDAEDIAQDTFLQAFRRLPEFRAASEFYTWIYRIALHLGLNVRRRNARRRCEPLDDPRVELAVAADAGGDPRRAAELRQIYARLLVTLDGLPASQRAAVVLVALQGLSHEEAGRVLACRAGTVAWRLHRARRQLGAALRAAVPPTPGADGQLREEDSLLIRLLPATPG